MAIDVLLVCQLTQHLVTGEQGPTVARRKGKSEAVRERERRLLSPVAKGLNDSGALQPLDSQPKPQQVSAPVVLQLALVQEVWDG